MRNASAIVLLVAAVVAGAIADGGGPSAPIDVGGYRVLQADFHTHSSTWSDGALTPIGMVLEARARGLDAFAITGHNQIWDSHLGHWFTRVVGGPIVLRGQEVLSPTHHIIAVGITTTVEYLQDAAGTIADIHAQGGIAIAAHPDAAASDYDARALAALDGSEICHPLGYIAPDVQQQFAQFRTRGTFAAIGSSDFHGMGQMGMCRTYVFVREASEAGILEAIRARRTVVYAASGVYGDPQLIKLVADDRRFGQSLPPRAQSAAAWASGVLGLAGLAALLARPTFKLRSSPFKV
jgi:hypothetical protein